MQIERITNAEALDRLQRVCRTAQTELPTFVAAPRAVVTRDVEGDLRVIYECEDHANDATYVIEVSVGRGNRNRVPERLIEMEAEALERASLTARAVFN